MMDDIFSSVQLKMINHINDFITSRVRVYVLESVCINTREVVFKISFTNIYDDKEECEVSCTKDLDVTAVRINK